MLNRDHMLLNREAGVAAELMASGITILGRANYATPGLYGQAFFNLSIGLERAAKIVYVSDYAIENTGKFPSDHELKNRFGHNLEKILAFCEEVQNKYRIRESIDRPSTSIHWGILKVLNEFAGQTRYYNLSALSSKQKMEDPLAAWKNLVIDPIILKHCSSRKRNQIEEKARIFDSLMGPVTVVNFRDESGVEISSVYQASRRTELTAIARKWAPFYLLQIARWLSEIIDDCSRHGAYELRIEALLGIKEHFAVFRNDDRYLKSRRTWSIYQP